MWFLHVNAILTKVLLNLTPSAYCWPLKVMPRKLYKIPPLTRFHSLCVNTGFWFEIYLARLSENGVCSGRWANIAIYNVNRSTTFNCLARLFRYKSFGVSLHVRITSRTPNFSSHMFTFMCRLSLNDIFAQSRENNTFYLVPSCGLARPTCTIDIDINNMLTKKRELMNIKYQNYIQFYIFQWLFWLYISGKYCSQKTQHKLHYSYFAVWWFVLVKPQYALEVYDLSALCLYCCVIITGLTVRSNCERC